MEIEVFKKTRKSVEYIPNKIQENSGMKFSQKLNQESNFEPQIISPRSYKEISDFISEETPEISLPSKYPDLLAAKEEHQQPGIENHISVSELRKMRRCLKF